jgi:ketosteroid isomerase-like protein
VTEDSLALARAWLGALNSGDYEAVLAATAEEVVIVPRLAAVEGDTYEGHAGLRRWLELRAEVWAEMEGELTDLRPVGDGVVGVGVLRGSSTTGLTVEEPIAGVIRFRDGKAYWVGFFRTEAEALEAAGLGA